MGKKIDRKAKLGKPQRVKPARLRRALRDIGPSTIFGGGCEGQGHARTRMYVIYEGLI